MKKVISVDGTFLRSKYGGVMLSTVAQDTENHILSVVFSVMDKEYDTSYDLFLKYEKLCR